MVEQRTEDRWNSVCVIEILKQRTNDKRDLRVYLVSSERDGYVMEMGRENGGEEETNVLKFYRVSRKVKLSGDNFLKNVK